MSDNPQHDDPVLIHVILELPEARP